MLTRVTNEWLRRRIEKDPDVETEAGLPITKPEILQAFVPEKRTRAPERPRAPAEPAKAAEGNVLGTLLRQLRRRDKMPLARLATEVRVPEDELVAIEEDRSFMPKPRTIYQLALYYKLPPQALYRLSPAAPERNTTLDEAAVRFAARSDNLSKLSAEERKRLNDFIKVLSDYKERPRENAD